MIEYLVLLNLVINFAVEGSFITAFIGLPES